MLSNKCARIIRIITDSLSHKEGDRGVVEKRKCTQVFLYYAIGNYYYLRSDLSAALWLLSSLSLNSFFHYIKPAHTTPEVLTLPPTL